jgi:hypothetical protein
MHAAIGLAMGMYLFAFVMIVLNVAAFGIGMSNGRRTAAEIPVGGTEQHTSISERSAFGASPLRG